MSSSSAYLRLQPRLQRLRSLNLSKTTKHFLKASAEPILRAFRLPHSEFAEFPRGKPTILEWAKNLIAHYSSSEDLDAAEINRRRMNMLMVKELRWYKGVVGIEHEYVVAIIADTQYACERFIRLDRARDDPGPDMIATNRRYARSSETFSSSQSSLSFYDDPEDSVSGLDVMWVLHELPEKDRLIERSTFWTSHGGNHAPNHAPTLLDLALVAKAVHENNNYHLWQRQCVWFSTMIVRVLQSDFRHQVTHRDSSLTFQNWMMEVMEEGIGTSKARSIYKEQEQVTGEIILAYRATRIEVMTRIEEAISFITKHRGRHEYIGEAVSQRDEAAAIAAAASANSVEATARAAEAVARAAEAEARAERESRLRQEAEEKAYDEARKNAMSERELRDLRRRLEELESLSRSRGRQRH